MSNIIQQIREERDNSYGDPQVSGRQLGEATQLALQTWWRKHSDIPAHAYWLLRAIEKIFRALYTDDPVALKDSYIDAEVYIRMASQTDPRVEQEEDV